jgi:hypothetical protein
MRILPKVLILSIVCFLTWWTTRAIVAQQPSRRSPVHPAVVEPSAKTIATTTEIKPDSEFTPIKLGKSGAFVEAHLRSGNISVEGGVATVKAQVSLADKRKGVSYVWRLRVVDPQDNPLAGQVYGQQIFSVEANNQKEVDFQDFVEVPPGARRIELVLYGKPTGKDLSFLDDASTARGYQMIRLVKLLTD